MILHTAVGAKNRGGGNSRPSGSSPPSRQSKPNKSTQTKKNQRKKKDGDGKKKDRQKDVKNAVIVLDGKEIKCNTVSKTNCTCATILCAKKKACKKGPLRCYLKNYKYINYLDAKTGKDCRCVGRRKKGKVRKIVNANGETVEVYEEEDSEKADPPWIKYNGKPYNCTGYNVNDESPCSCHTLLCARQNAVCKNSTTAVMCRLRETNPIENVPRLFATTKDCQCKNMKSLEDEPEKSEVMKEDPEIEWFKKQKEEL